MKALLAILTSCTLTGAAAEMFHEFTVTDGRKLKAKMVSYDGKSRRVEIEREDGKVVAANIGAFVPEDHAYIRQWEPISLFMSPRIPITLSRVEVRNWKKINESTRGSQGGGGGGGRGGGGGPGGGQNDEGGVLATDRYARYRYDVKISNRSSVSLENLKIDYCIYYEQERAVAENSGFESQGRQQGPDSRGGGKEQASYHPVCEKKVQSGTLSVAALDAGLRKVLPTESVTILNRNASGEGEGEMIDLEGELKGIWVKVSMKAPDGTLRVREVAHPRNITRSVEWNPVVKHKQGETR